MSLVKLVEMVRDHAHRDVELTIVVRNGSVHWSVFKVKRSSEEVRSLAFTRDDAKQLVANRSSSIPWRSGSSKLNEVDYVAEEIITELAENAVAASAPMRKESE